MTITATDAHADGRHASTHPDDRAHFAKVCPDCRPAYLFATMKGDGTTERIFLDADKNQISGPLPTLADDATWDDVDAMLAEYGVRRASRGYEGLSTAYRYRLEPLPRTLRPEAAALVNGIFRLMLDANALDGAHAMQGGTPRGTYGHLHHAGVRALTIELGDEHAALVVWGLMTEWCEAHSQGALDYAVKDGRI